MFHPNALRPRPVSDPGRPGSQLPRSAPSQKAEAPEGSDGAGLGTGPRPQPSAREEEDQEIQKQRRGGPSMAPPRARPLRQARPSSEAKGPPCHGANLRGRGLFKQPRKGGQATFHREPPTASQNLMAAAHPHPLVPPTARLLAAVQGAAGKPTPPAFPAPQRDANQTPPWRLVSIISHTGEGTPGKGQENVCAHRPSTADVKAEPPTSAEAGSQHWDPEAQPGSRGSPSAPWAQGLHLPNQDLSSRIQPRRPGC